VRDYIVVNGKKEKRINIFTSPGGGFSMFDAIAEIQEKLGIDVEPAKPRNLTCCICEKPIKECDSYQAISKNMDSHIQCYENHKRLEAMNE
jgi:hypothetical protein